jgi:hypothetical protein
VNPAQRAAALWAQPRVRVAVAVLAFAAVTLVTYLIAHPRMFSGFANYDDEGYMLTALKGFVNHGDLYDGVFTQYGPFYYEFWGGIFSTFGIAVTHEAGRAATLVAWVLSSLLLGLATMRITASLLLGLATQALVFTALGVLTNEPMHPVGIIALLLAAIVAVSCFVRERLSPYAIAGLGGLLAALFLVKINVGAFAIASVAFVCVLSYPALSARRWLRILAELAFVALPVLLMLSKLGEGWARHYAIHVALAALALVIALRAREQRQRSNEELAWLLGGFALVFVLSCVTIVVAGTSFNGLVEGVIRQPLRQADAFTIPMHISRRFYALNVLALGAAAAFWYASRGRRGAAPGPTWVAATSLFSIGVGVALALSVSGKTLPFDAGTITGYQLSMLPFAWVALLAQPSDRPAVAFAALLLPPLAVLQALHGYPVAGSQTLLSAFLLVPVGALCVANGVRGLAAVVPAGPDRRALAGFGAVAAIVLLWFVANANLREPLRDAPVGYDGGVSLGLPGSDSIHVGEEEAQLYGEVTAAIDRNCPALVMLPGMNSFYLWSEQEPPSFTATGWETLFDDSRQRQVVADTRDIAGLCLLRNRALASGWGEAPGPLTRYLEGGDFAPVATFGDYELLARPGTA